MKPLALSEVEGTWHLDTKAKRTGQTNLRHFDFPDCRVTSEKRLSCDGDSIGKKAACQPNLQANLMSRSLGCAQSAGCEG
mmetsp:Transcript_4893/g.15625  ORF Transcript_4893/g.15625 Transcript_4893/m.15625 type:complete len:80 (-) Transcript_4893:1082-1321(-)|eukprot:scaffold170635_cov28-Tisochrysis_lutea.AAC.3